ncbi:MAG: LysR family transcriptional regulator [Pseudomonadota bacterium]
MQNFDLFRLDGHSLRVFASVCETGSVSRTAELFDVNQSTISHTLDKMRAAVGDPLFVKSGRGITPSEKALAILPRVQKILTDIEGLVAPEKYDASRDIRPFVLAIPTPALLPEMKALHANLLAVDPDSEFELRRMAPREMVTRLLSEDEADLAITVAGFRYSATLNHCHYGEDHFVIFYDEAQRGPIKTAEDYAKARHGAVNFGGANKSVVERALNELGLKRRISVVAPTASMLGDLVQGTDIVATMPSRLATAAYANLAYTEPPFVLPSVEYHLVWHRRYEHSGRNAWLRAQVMAARFVDPVPRSKVIHGTL